MTRYLEAVLLTANTSVPVALSTLSLWLMWNIKQKRGTHGP